MGIKKTSIQLNPKIMSNGLTKLQSAELFSLVDTKKINFYYNKMHDYGIY